MAKMRMSVLLIGATILVLITVVSTYLVLLLTNVIPSDPIKVEILISDVEKVYDGTPLVASNYTFGEGSKLLKGHNLELEYIGSLTDAGSIQSNAVAHVYDGDHTDKTSDYTFKIVKGNITVTKKHVSLAVKNESIDYGDGTNLSSKANYEITNGGLCSGHKLVPTYTFNENPDSTLSTTMQAEIFDANGANVTKNYEIEYRSGLLDINKTKLTFKTESKTKTYDGEAFSDADFETTLAYGTLPEGYSYDVLYNYTGKGNVGTTQLVISKVAIYDNHGDEVTDKFEISVQNTGILTINPIEIDIAVSNKEYEYDGLEHTWTEFEVQSDANILVDQSDTTRFTYNKNDYSVSVKSSTKAINAGSIINILNFRITDAFGEDVTSNYRINQSSAILTVVKRPLIIYADSKTFEYDERKTYTINSNEPKEQQGKVNGHTITIEYSDKTIIKDAGTVPAEIYSYTILDESGVDVTQNYNVTKVNGTLTVTKKKITITGTYVDDTIDYISTYYTNGGYDVQDKDATNDSDGDFVFALDDLDFKVTVSKYNFSNIYHAGTYDIIPTEYKLSKGNTELTQKDLANYDITITPIKVEIKRIPVFIKVESMTVVQNSIVIPDFTVTTFEDLADFEYDFYVEVDDFDTTKLGSINVGIILETNNPNASLDDYILTVTPGIITVVTP